MPQLVFLADIHNEGNAIAESLQNAEVNTSEGSIAVLLELDQGDEYFIPESEYGDVLDIIFEDKIDSEDYQLVSQMMGRSNNSVYAFDAPGGAKSLSRQNGQRANINNILNISDVEGKTFVVVIDGIAHLQINPEVAGWQPLQITPPNYPASVTNIAVGFPNGEDIGG